MRDGITLGKVEQLHVEASGMEAGVWGIKCGEKTRVNKRIWKKRGTSQASSNTFDSGSQSGNVEEGTKVEVTDPSYFRAKIILLMEVQVNQTNQRRGVVAGLLGCLIWLPVIALMVSGQFLGRHSVSPSFTKP